ncbi:MAG: hypothetical protein PHE88_11950 [Elusimicrobia bacterium]|nr:hypothetical protein [Elusimicrobiota bacterium]
MKPVYTYKALSNTIFFFGFQPIDVGIILVSTLMVWGGTNSYKIGLVWLCLVFFLGKKLKHRSGGSEKAFLLFMTTPNKLGVSTRDIPAYRSIKCQK